MLRARGVLNREMEFMRAVHESRYQWLLRQGFHQRRIVRQQFDDPTISMLDFQETVNGLLKERATKNAAKRN